MDVKTYYKNYREKNQFDFISYLSDLIKRENFSSQEYETLNKKYNILRYTLYTILMVGFISYAIYYIIKLSQNEILEIENTIIVIYLTLLFILRVIPIYLNNSKFKLISEYNNNLYKYIYIDYFPELCELSENKYLIINNSFHKAKNLKVKDSEIEEFVKGYIIQRIKLEKSNKHQKEIDEIKTYSNLKD